MKEFKRGDRVEVLSRFPEGSRAPAKWRAATYIKLDTDLHMVTRDDGEGDPWWTAYDHEIRALVPLPVPVPAPAHVRTSAMRKGQPIATGVLAYFPKATAALAAHSKRGNDKHNPGAPLHWAREKSTDEVDCLVRHIVDALAEGPLAEGILDDGTPDGCPHVIAALWRAFAWAERVLDGDERWRGVSAPTKVEK